MIQKSQHDFQELRKQKNSNNWWISLIFLFRSVDLKQDPKAWTRISIQAVLFAWNILRMKSVVYLGIVVIAIRMNIYIYIYNNVIPPHP